MPTGKAAGKGSIFANFETVQLTTDERIYLDAARLGDTGLLNQMMQMDENQLNVNCVDFMGRNALHLAVDSDNIEAVEILLERLSFECIEEALLHAISQGSLNVVRVIIDNPSYLVGEKENEFVGKKDTFFREEEKYQFPPDITPLILASHRNDPEIVQVFLARGHTLDKPHAIHCRCEKCQVKQSCDSLKRSRSRLNAYKALASPAFMALSSPDPITTTFELRQEMKQVAQVEKEFRNEYLDLVEQCMDFACELMDLCRGTQEVAAVLSAENVARTDPLARLKLAIQYGEKKFVAHPNCQQHLTNVWYGKEMSFLQSMSWAKKILLGSTLLPILPFCCIWYFLNPRSKIAAVMRCPVTKFVMHGASHMAFLFFLAVATFGLEGIFDGWPDTMHPSNSSSVRNRNKLQSTLRPARSAYTTVQVIIVVWIVGLLWVECKQIYSSGAKEHFMQYYNIIDFSILALYMASYTLRFVAKYRVDKANLHFNATQRALEALETKNMQKFKNIIQETMDQKNFPHNYFIRASRFAWCEDDPEIVSDILFAVANVLSFARTTYVMPAHEVLGPLQISLGRMLGDIARFLVLFLLVLMAFMVGLTNLYRYYGSQINKTTRKAATETFKGLPETVHTLFFSIFGLIPLDKLKVVHPEARSSSEILREDSTNMVDRVGLCMFAIYEVVIIIVLINMLIAMMSHSFEAIQGEYDVEWKYARTKLWLDYINEGGTLPVPFNIIPTPKTFKYAFQYLGNICCDYQEKPTNYDYTRRRENVTVAAEEGMSLLATRTTYCDIMNRLVKRYLFKLEREKKAQESTDGTTVRTEETSVSGNTMEEMTEETCTIRESSEEQKTQLSDVMESQEENAHKKVVPGPEIPQLRVGSGRRSLSDSSYDSHLRLSRKQSVLIRRGGRRGSSPSTRRPSAQLEAIQRGQRMLDARLADLQTTSRSDEATVKENVEHIRHLLTENQKAMGSLVMAISNIQGEINFISDMQTELIKAHGGKAVASDDSNGKQECGGSGKGATGGSGNKLTVGRAAGTKKLSSKGASAPRTGGRLKSFRRSFGRKKSNEAVAHV